ncbi:MAG: fumarylacetoacetate hydrolase family protein [Desulfamplus sp.]|nr:fumarylacetoacetate hydrolase family protein [Desulfamplus sp.]
MRIIKFLDIEGNEWRGCDIKGGSASIVEGDIFGSFVVTARRVQIKTILEPFQPIAILCIGLNYKMHAQETGMPLPEHPVLFMKNPAAVTGPYSDIEIPKSCLDPLQVDYEVELGVVIGKTGKNIRKENALDHVFGYTCANDISARRWQKHSGGGQWVRGKSFDTFCPLGPAIITKDEVEDPQKLELICKLNGEVMQKSSTSDMIFSVAELISRLSESMTLLSGTIILTGTPSGVGFARKPQIFLKPGDILESIIIGVGEMKNLVVAEKELA